MLCLGCYLLVGKWYLGWIGFFWIYDVYVVWVCDGVGCWWGDESGGDVDVYCLGWVFEEWNVGNDGNVVVNLFGSWIFVWWGDWWEWDCCLGDGWCGVCFSWYGVCVVFCMLIVFVIDEFCLWVGEICVGLVFVGY